MSNLEDLELQRLLEGMDWVETPLRYFVVGKVGVNSARNIGIESASGAVILFVDDDCRMDDPDFLAKHLAAHVAYPLVAGLGGRYSLPPGSSGLMEAYHRTAEDWLDRSMMEARRSRHLLGGNSSFKADFLKNFSGGLRFDEGIEFGGSETEFQLRIAELGGSLVLLDDLEIRHECGIHLRGLIRKAYLQGVGSARLVHRHGKSRRGSSLRADPVSAQSGSLDGRKAKRLAVRVGIWIYRRAFELGEREARMPRPALTLLQWFIFAMGREIEGMIKFWVYPVIRETLYIARVHFEKKLCTDGEDKVPMTDD